MQKPSFYCENCGREVPSNMETCPGCGQDFSSVRCPSCGFTGESDLFKKSCPECGYSGEEVLDGTPDPGKAKNYSLSRNPFPLWVYKVLIGALLILIIYLIGVYFIL